MTERLHQDDSLRTDISTRVSRNANATENGGSETNSNEANGEIPLNSNTSRPIASTEPDDRIVRTSSGRVSRLLSVMVINIEL